MMKTDKSNNLSPSSFYLYCNEIRKYPLLSAEQEKELFIRLSSGDLEAKNDLINANLRLVLSIALKFAQGPTIELLDLIQVGNIGLMKAIDMFDIDKENRFSTYATWWIMQEIRKYVIKEILPIHIPPLKLRKIFKLTRYTAQYKEKMGCEPSDEEISLALDIEEKELKDLRSCMYSFFSLYQPITNSDSSGEYYEFIPSDEKTPEELYLFKERKDVIALVLKDVKLTSDQSYVIEHRFLVEEPETLATVANKLNLSKARVQMIEKSALVKLKRYFMEKGMRDLNF